MATAKKSRRAERRDSKRTSDQAAETARLERVRSLIKILEASTLAELEYEDADVAVKLRRAAQPGAVSAPPSLPAAPAPTTRPQPSQREAEKEKAPPSEEPGVHVIRSPFVGTFYRSPQPDAAPYTDVGQKVRRGQTVCIVEAMKLMNEIESEVDGSVLEVLVKNGAAVQYGDALMRIRVS